ncbi:Uncharacterised protein [Kluyvera cryocrescens]|uniref:Uncharacterized protein n=1 Tax=Kluyvera cryocrescens TaxID=580 RepID=A0A485D0J5_KLUCR|nr:Uncharacterised protein [Kluyvera cryocrescens]
MIVIEGLTKQYAGSGQPALNDVSFTVRKERFTEYWGAAARVKAP